MSWFSGLVTAATSAASKVSASLNMDALQTQFGVDKTKAALEDLGVTYLTPRLLAMGFPSSPTTKIQSRTDGVAVAAALSAAHGTGHVMVWNLSEETYDYALFHNHVVEARFAGLPAPPLGLLARLCAGIESWLAQEPENVAVGASSKTHGRIFPPPARKSYKSPCRSPPSPPPPPPLLAHAQPQCTA